MEMAEIYPTGKKTLTENEKLLFTSNFSFSQDVLKRLALQNRKDRDLFAKELRVVTLSNTIHSLNPLSDNKILDWSKLKAFTDDKIKLAKMMIFVFERSENPKEKGENTVTIFSFSHNIFKRLITQGR